ncbi:fumarylacetoacetate hydrolase family protein [Phycisphaera mikurensis]|uniref:Fumarylacetoacetate hydrolase family protein n=1 Tax=Phycisphaera mikurensis (strain NBRC 102666 / KCTC 22515 / FYK2301M01) TaxID=1142394 RepID=I0ICV8_PHYMF|nr:fumarylacetoacetate hydrolase family protein [Phycisphaera mikurensis]MBB6442227.1 2-keto-4-pentenoate hydratase/2-oxohepta-3-ene-1,7-dioic acid hydratase in catechol pathway [Phycisphaera mikurensis]BAM03096.1 fumarylacetoacetate hydrolase family protein [Phycisphaera mikurensis NBRC 102666]
MRWCRIGPAGQEKLGCVDAEERVRDASSLGSADEVVSFAAAGPPAAAALDALPRAEAGVRFGSCVPRPGKILCIGLNYSDHAEEAGMEVPKEPILFFKAPNTVVGPDDDIRLPRGGDKTDWEVELGVVIGREARYLESDEEALACVAGYCISHDVSERAFQLERGGQWCKGKSCDTFNPLGPWLVTPDEVGDVADLGMTLDVNGERMQDGTTSTMIFGVAELIRYASAFMTLEPGDLITTGTPPGVGMGQKPPRYLQAGDVVELAIDGLGRQRSAVVAADES